MKKKITRNFRFAVVMALVVSAFANVVPTTLLANDEPVVESRITYNETDNSATIHLDLSKVDQSQYKVVKVSNPDGDELNLEDVKYTVYNNETYGFKVYYYLQADLNDKSESAQGALKVKSTDVKVKVDTIKIEDNAEIVTPVQTLQDIVPYAVSAETDFKNSFKISSTGGGIRYLADNQIELGNNYSEHYTFYMSGAYWTGKYAKFAAVSKYKMNFNKNFNVNATLSSDPSLYGDGFTMGFQTNPDLIYTPQAGGSIGIYRYGKNYGAKNGVIFEVDYHNNEADWHDHNLGANHIAIHTTDATGTESAPIVSQKNIVHTGGTEKFTAKWVITNAATGTGDLTFEYSKYTLTYRNFQPHKVFGGSAGNSIASYLTLSGVVLEDFGSKNNPFQITLGEVAELKDEVNASDAIITQSEARALANEDALIPFNKATAKNALGQVITPQTVVGFWPQIKAGNVGVYNVNYFSGSTSKMVKLNIVQDGTVLPPDRSFGLYAQDGTIKQSDAMKITAASQLFPYNKAMVTLPTGVVESPRASTANYADIMAGIPGVYTIKYGHGIGVNYVEKEVTLEVVADAKHEIIANDGFIYQSQARALTAQNQLIPYNGASAITNTGVTVVPTATTGSWNDIVAGNIGTYHVTYDYGSGTTKGEKTVKLTVVQDGSVIPPNKGFSLFAENGLISVENAKKLKNTAELIPYNSASVILADASSAIPTVISTSWTSIIAGVEGIYNVTYSYGVGADQVSKVVTLSVIDGINPPDNSFLLSARDGFIYDTQAKTLTAQNELISYNAAKVVLKNGAVVSPRVSTSAWSAITSGSIGLHKIKYGYGSGANEISKEVNLNVIEDGSIIPPDNSYAIYATNGLITQDEAQALSNQNELIPFNKAKVTLKDGSVVAPRVASASWANIKAGEVGKYTVAYSYGSGANEKTVSVTLEVTKNGVYPPDRSFMLYAEDAFISQTDAKALSNQEAIAIHNKAEVTLANGTKTTPTVETTQFADIKAGRIGTYDVTYSYGSGANETSKTVNLIVVEDGSIIPPDNSYAIYATNGLITQDEAQTLSNQNELIPFNKAKVTLKDGSVVAPRVASPNWTKIKAGEIGKYTVTYSYGSGVNEKTVSVTLEVTKNGVYPPDRSFMLYAEDAFISQADAKALANQAALATHNKAEVTLANGTKTTPTVEATQFADIKVGKMGTYDVTYSYGSGANYKEILVKLTIHSGDISPSGNYILNADNAFISQSDAKALGNVNDLALKHQATVIRKDGAVFTPVATVLPADWLMIKAGTVGSYSVLYSYGSGADFVQKSVQLIVYKEGGTLSPDGDFVLNADHAIISQSEAKALANANALAVYNRAEATMNDFSVVAANASTTEFASIKAGTEGKYVITYHYGTGANLTQKSVNLIVVKDETVISSDRAYALYAEHVNLTQVEGEALVNKEAFIPKAQAVVTLADGTFATPTVSVSDWANMKAGKAGTYVVEFDYKDLNKKVNAIVSQEYIVRHLFDYDNNGRIDILDYVVFTSYMSGNIVPSKIDFYISDANGDGRIDILDLAEIRVFLANPTLPLVEVKIPM